MKKKYGCLALAACLLLGSAVTVQAEEYTVGQDWRTQFADGKMTSNFSSSDVADAVGDLQPGDSVTISLTLENRDSRSTDWYMTNEVLSSLEDSQSAASGGAYTYILTYTNGSGDVNTLYSSESVGGEKNSAGGEGLHEVSASLEEFFYLDRLASGGTGKVSLTVALDGDSNGNGYQNTLARLQMAFAADPVTGGGSGGGSGSSGGSGGSSGSGGGTPASPASVAYTLGGVQTGDGNDLMLWSSVALISGLLLLIYGVICWKREKGEREHA